MTDVTHTIAITGGHLTPALAVIQEITASALPWKPVFFGRKFAMEGDTASSEEYRIVTGMGIPFVSLDAGRLRREFSIAALRALAKTPRGFFQAYRELKKSRPDAVLSFGGYVALPVVLAAKILGIPSVTHEQTRTAGLANRIIALFADTVCVSYPGEEAGFFGKKTVLTGLPVRKEIRKAPSCPSFDIDTSVPMVYVTGGATGSQSVNEIVFTALPELLPSFAVVHQTGQRSLSEAQKIAGSLPGKLKRRYVPMPYLDISDQSWTMNTASLVVGRSGANTVAEVAVTGKRALFIPLPWAAGGEQEKNARMLERAGMARVVLQDRLTPQALVSGIRDMIRTPVAGKRVDVDIPKDAAAAIVHEVGLVVGHHGQT